MNPSILLQQLARLSAQPLIIRSDAGIAHGLRMIGLMRRALSADAQAGLSADAANPQKPWEAREAIRFVGPTAIVPVHGTLCAGLDPITAWWLDCARVEALQASVALLSARTDIRNVVFDFASPGGYVTGITETAELMARDLAGKLTVAWSASQDCSAAFWLSCACHRIVFAPSATVANIGVLQVVYDYSKMFEEAGIGVKVFKTGEYKGAGVMGTSLTADQEKFIQERVDELGAKFLATVQAARPDAKESDMQGQWFTGEQAVARKLADATALNLDELLSTLASITPA
jgi:ClpP class serine protease